MRSGWLDLLLKVGAIYGAKGWYLGWRGADRTKDRVEDSGLSLSRGQARLDHESRHKIFSWGEMVR